MPQLPPIVNKKVFHLFILNCVKIIFVYLFYYFSFYKKLKLMYRIIDNFLVVWLLSRLDTTSWLNKVPTAAVLGAQNK